MTSLDDNPGMLKSVGEIVAAAFQHGTMMVIIEIGGLRFADGLCVTGS
jgi:glycerate kinase